MEWNIPSFLWKVTSTFSSVWTLRADVMFAFVSSGVLGPHRKAQVQERDMIWDRENPVNSTNPSEQ